MNLKMDMTDISNGMEFSNIYIVIVLIPIDKYNSPDLTSLVKVSRSLGKVFKKDNDIKGFFDKSLVEGRL